jgi:TonB family protein
MLLHLTLFSLFAVIVIKREGNKDIEYIPVELIRPSGDGQRATGGSNRPPDAQLKESDPRQIPPAEEISGLINKVPETSPDAPSPAQAASPSYGNVSGPSQEGTGYQPFHTVSRVPFFKVQKKPAYPPSERTAGVEARVIVEVYINERGMVDKVKLVKSGGPLFDQAVMTAAMNSSFEPGYVDGKPVPVRVQIPYAFKLR